MASSIPAFVKSFAKGVQLEWHKKHAKNNNVIILLPFYSLIFLMTTWITIIISISWRKIRYGNSTI